MSHLSYTQGREIERCMYEYDWPYYGLVQAAQNIMKQIMSPDMASRTVFAIMLSRFGRIDRTHLKAAEEYSEMAVRNGWLVDALIQALMRRADTSNKALLVDQFPETYADLIARYDAPGGVLPGDTEEEQ